MHSPVSLFPRTSPDNLSNIRPYFIFRDDFFTMEIIAKPPRKRKSSSGGSRRIQASHLAARDLYDIHLVAKLMDNLLDNLGCTENINLHP